MITGTYKSINSALKGLTNSLMTFGAPTNKPMLTRGLYNYGLTITNPAELILPEVAEELNFKWDPKYAKFLWRWYISEYTSKSKVYTPKPQLSKWFNNTDAHTAFKLLQEDPYRTAWIYPEGPPIVAIGLRVEVPHLLELDAPGALKMVVCATKAISLFNDFIYYQYCLGNFHAKIANTLEIPIGQCDYFLSYLYL